MRFALATVLIGAFLLTSCARLTDLSVEPIAQQTAKKPKIPASLKRKCADLTPLPDGSTVSDLIRAAGVDRPNQRKCRRSKAALVGAVEAAGL